MTLKALSLTTTLTLLTAPPAAAQDLLAIPEVARDEVICFALYTVHDQTLKMTAQLYPLRDGEARAVELQVERGDTWQAVATADVLEDGWTAHLRVDGWDDSRDARYRVVHPGGASYEGLIRKNPKEDDEIVIAGFTGNSIRPAHGGDIARTDLCREREAARRRPAFLLRRPGLRPQPALRRVAQVRTRLRLDPPRPAVDHDPRRPRRRTGQPVGPQRQAGEQRRGQRRRLLQERRLRQPGGARADEPPPRPVRPDADRPRHRRLLHVDDVGRSQLRDPRGPQVQDRAEGDDPAAGPASRPHPQPRLRPGHRRRPRGAPAGRASAPIPRPVGARLDRRGDESRAVADDLLRRRAHPRQARRPPARGPRQQRLAAGRPESRDHSAAQGVRGALRRRPAPGDDLSPRRARVGGLDLLVLRAVDRQPLPALVEAARAGRQSKARSGRDPRTSQGRLRQQGDGMGSRQSGIRPRPRATA